MANQIIIPDISCIIQLNMQCYNPVHLKVDDMYMAIFLCQLSMTFHSECLVNCAQFCSIHLSRISLSAVNFNFAQLHTVYVKYFINGL